MTPTLAQSQLFSTTERIFAAAGFVGAVTGAFVVRNFNPATAGFFPVCPLFTLTGIACPGCGLTRGFHALFNGDIIGAFDFNAMIPIYALLIFYLLLPLISVAIRGRGLASGLFNPKIVYGFMTLALVFGVLRNLPFEPFRWLMP